MSWKRKKSQDVNIEVTPSDRLAWAWTRALTGWGRILVSARTAMFLSSSWKSDSKRGTGVERKRELVPYYFPMYVRENDVHIYYVTSRTQKPKTRCKPHRQIRRWQCMYQNKLSWGRRAGYFVTCLIYTHWILQLESLLETIQSNIPIWHVRTVRLRRSLMTCNIMQRLANVAGDTGLLTYTHTSLSFLQFPCNHCWELGLCLIPPTLLCVSWLSTSYSMNCFGLKFILQW